MPTRSPSTYTPLGNEGGANNGVENVRWYWKVIAFSSGWLLLSGFLCLPPLCERDAQLRISPAILTVLAAVFLTAGISFTVLSSFAVRSWQFQLDWIYLPSFGSSLLGLLVLLFQFIVSHRYYWGTAAIIGVIVSANASLAYGLASLLTQRKITATQIGRRYSSHTRQDPLPYDSTQAIPWQDHNTGVYTYPSGETVHAVPMQTVYPAFRRDEDMTRQQLTLLLAPSTNTANPSASPGAQSTSTFRLELPRRTDTTMTEEEIPLATPPARAWVDHHEPQDTQPDGKESPPNDGNGLQLLNAARYQPIRGDRRSREERQKQIEMRG